MKKLILIVMASLLLTACGVKNQLTKPDGNITSRDQNDPSQPPYPIGR